MNKIVVVGSSNIDMMAKVSHLPSCGETVCNAVFTHAVGGKGMNQAIAAARLGGDVTFVTALGNDHYADMLSNMLHKEGIVTDYVIYDNENPTGTALIYVSNSGDNCIAVASGANSKLQPELVHTFEKAIRQADIVLMQAEIPYSTIRSTALLAHDLGKKVILNLAPVCQVDSELLAAVDVLVVNEIEGAAVAGIPYSGDNLDEIIERLQLTGIRNIVVTAGSAGAYLLTPFTRIHVPSFKVNAVDTIAAGDTFCGALAVVFEGDYITEENMRYANAASAIAVTRPGATTSIPDAGEVAQFIASQTTVTSISTEKIEQNVKKTVAS